MSVSVTTSPSETADVVKAALHANLFSVFDERDETARVKAVKETYDEDIIWYEPDRVIKGHDALSARAAEIQNEAPGFKFQADGDMVITQNMGMLHWKFGPDETPDLVQGADVIIVEGGKVKLLWTAVTKAPGM